jgi:hypothetical protein
MRHHGSASAAAAATAYRMQTLSDGGQSAANAVSRCSIILGHRQTVAGALLLIVPNQRLWRRCRSLEPVPPFGFLQRLRTLHPQFAQQSPRGGGFMQQDAEELYSALLNTLALNLKQVCFH